VLPRHDGQDACEKLLCLSSHAYKGHVLKYKLAQLSKMQREIVQVSVCYVEQKTLLCQPGQARQLLAGQTEKHKTCSRHLAVLDVQQQHT